MTTPIMYCTCGHSKADHTDEGTGTCHEPTLRCGCPAYAELCPTCRHARTTHAGLNGQCTVTKQDTRQPCGCTRYVTPAA